MSGPLGALTQQMPGLYQTSIGPRLNVEQAAREFEALFITNLLRIMRESLDQSELFGSGLGGHFYMDLIDQQLGRALAERGGIGIADLLIRQLEAGERVGDGEQRAAPPLLPVVQGRLSSGYGWRTDPVTGDIKFHRGLDIAAPEGTTVRAAADGMVAFAGWLEGYGNALVIDHGAEVQTRYAHLRAFAVSEGERVKAGQAIAEVGSSGRATGAHLHFELIRKGSPMALYLRP